MRTNKLKLKATAGLAASLIIGGWTVPPVGLDDLVLDPSWCTTDWDCEMKFGKSWMWTDREMELMKLGWALCEDAQHMGKDEGWYKIDQPEVEWDLESALRKEGLL
jgi:hypothetical protein